MLTSSLIIAGIIVVLVILTLIGLMSRYRRCASDEILVVFGKAGKKSVANPTTGKSETVILPSKIIHGGGTFVFPVIQDWRKMSLKPIQIQASVAGVSSQMIKVTIPVTLTTGIGTTDTLMQNAASRFLTSSPQEISDQIKDILIGEVRSLMATMTIEEINADRVKFLGKAKENIETELNKVGFSIININNADITDDANYIRNLGKKAATKAEAQALADIAEEKKKGDIQIAETEKERQIAVANAEKERATQVAETKQQQEVRVAEINQEKEIKLAEADKVKESGVANQQAEKAANVAKAQAEAEAATAARKAEAVASVAKSEAEAASAQAEAEAQKQIRMAKAEQEQEAETQKAINEQEAKVAEYESLKRQRAAEADKQAGVAEQTATIEVSKAKGEAAKAEAEAQRVAGVSKVNAEMEVAKTREEKQVEVNEVAAKATEAKLHAEVIVPAQKKKEQVTIEAEAIKQKAILEAEAEAAKITKEAEAKAQATQQIMEAEAEGTKKKLLAEAEGKRASLMAEADKITAIELAPAKAVEKMIECGMTPQMIVQYKTVDQLKGIAEASAQMFEHVHLGEVTVYGNENTAGNFMAKTAENLNPALDLLRSIPLKETFKDMFGKKAIETKPESEEKPETFEEVK